MELNIEQRAYLSNRRREIRRELEVLERGDPTLSYTDANEKRVELLDDLEQIEEELREDAWGSES